MIPNFFIVGTPKAGTTSLYHYLEEHPDIYMSPIKETNFFSFHDIKSQGLFYNEEYISTQEAYLALFEGVKNERSIGEASVSYLYYRDVPAKLKGFNPDAKIVVVLRNPIDRGFSHYLMDKRLGFVELSYKDIIAKSTNNKKVELYYQQYVELGLYYQQLQRYYSNFDCKQIKVFLYEELNGNINNVVKQLYEFLNVDPEFSPNLNTKHNTFLAPKNSIIRELYKYKLVRETLKAVFGQNLQDSIKQNFFNKERKPVLDATLKKQLIQIYKEDIDKTAKLLNRSLEHWYKTSED